LIVWKDYGENSSVTLSHLEPPVTSSRLGVAIKIR
jgi:hypothetical protein